MGNSHFLSFQGHFEGYSMGLADGFFVSLLTQRSELDFLLILFILFELANSVRNS